MTLTFKQFVAGETNIKPVNGLVTGWMVEVRDPDYGERAEVLFARYSDGTVKVAGPFPCPNPQFNKAGRKWDDEPDGVPMDAEFIGNYAPPV